ncbi:MAG TPA: isoaspartyl peptidase/L-asparaginase [Candidatus Kryptobacter bacterium]|nr:isoaspartyl peptidase/L-asparaginase [Candidatus Kryptobacter bacterium]
MRKNIFTFAALAIAAVMAVGLPNSGRAQERTNKYTIVIHGGAGTISESMPEAVKAQYYAAMKHALTIGRDVLANGGTSMEAVEKVIRYFETDPKFNAGIGAVFTSAGRHELDAAIMNGATLQCGAVAGVEHVAHPITLARLVMEKTPHILLAYQGADAFAVTMGMKPVPNSYFDTPERKTELEKWMEKIKKKDHGTVGCVCLDEYGNLAAGTSTGGLTGKMPGRIGDSPLVGDGTYANNQTCAVSGTGIGEEYMRNAVGFNINALMAYKGMSLKDAVHYIIHTLLKPNVGGVIAADREGNYDMDFNTTGMFRGVATSSGTFEVKIWKDK